MNEAQDKILEMLSEGKITAEEAETLLSSLEPDRTAGATARQSALMTDGVDQEFQGLPPDNRYYERILRISFVIAVGSLMLSGLGLALVYQNSGQVAFIGFVCLWSIFIVALLATLAIFVGQRAPWLHMRIQEKNGRRIAISFPVPLSLANWGLSLAQYFVPKDQAAYLQTASAIIDEMRRNPQQEPIFMDIDEDDGDHVQLYLG